MVDFKAAIRELVDNDASIKEASKQTSALRKRRTELKKQIMDEREKQDIEVINESEIGVTVERVVSEKPVPLAREHVIKAVSTVLNTGEADGERVFAAADRARPAAVHASLRLKKNKPVPAEGAGSNDEI